MNKQEEIKELYFNKGCNQKLIAEILNTSNKYVSRVLLNDNRYQEEKIKRNLIAKEKHKKNTIDYIKNKRSKDAYREYAILKQMHIQASIELSDGRKEISNRAFRDWNSSIYKYDKKGKSYVLKKEIITGIDVPKRIKCIAF